MPRSPYPAVPPDHAPGPPRRAAGHPQPSRELALGKPAAPNTPPHRSGLGQHTGGADCAGGTEEENGSVCSHCRQTLSLHVPIQQKAPRFLVQITIQVPLWIKHALPFLLVPMARKLILSVLGPKTAAFPKPTLSHTRMGHSRPPTNWLHQRASATPLRCPVCHFRCLATGRTTLQVSSHAFDNLIPMGTLRFLSYLFPYAI